MTHDLRGVSWQLSTQESVWLVRDCAASRGVDVGRARGAANWSLNLDHLLKDLGLLKAFLVELCLIGVAENTLAKDFWQGA